MLKGSDAVVGTMYTNTGVINALEKKGIEFKLADVGDKFVSRMLVEWDLLVGAEQSGHVIQRNFSECGDANIALLQSLLALEVLQTDLEKIKEEIDPHPYVLESMPLKDFENYDKPVFNEWLKTKNAFPKTKIIARKSGTENVVRVRVESKVDNIRKIMDDIKKICPSYEDNRSKL